MVYLKAENSKEEKYYFTDGVNKVSNSFTFKGTINKLNFLESIGVEVDTSSVDVDFIHYMG